MNKKIQAFTKATGQIMANLAERWADEKEYENIEDYRKPLLSHCETHGVTITKMLKEPFGCELTADGYSYRLTVKLTKTKALVQTELIG